MLSVIEREALECLTETERKIVMEYLKTKAAPKVISENLGVSVRTVYKALYKYRKALKERGLDVTHLYLTNSRNGRNRCNGNGKASAIQVARTHSVSGNLACHVPIEWLREEVRKLVEEYLNSLDGNRGYVRTGNESTDGRELELLEAMVSLLREINKNLLSIRQLLAEQGSFLASNQTVITTTHKLAAATNEDSGDLPSFVRDNPWINVLSSRR